MRISLSELKLGSLFDGIGGFPLVATWHGITPVWASEIEPACVSITKRHFPDMKHLGDITKINGTEIEPVDIITFGSPCQDLSVAGKRAGLAGERSGLFGEAIRIIEEMRESTNGKYPEFAVWENVLGALSSNGGMDFRAVLQAFTACEIPMPESGRWATAGMVRSGRCDVAWRVLDAQHWGVPQRRRRIFLVADFGGRRAGEVLLKPEGKNWHSQKGGAQGKSLAANVGAGIERRIGGIDTYGEEKITRAGEILRILRESVGAESFGEWIRGVLVLFQQKKVLQFDVYGQSKLTETEKSKKQICREKDGKGYGANECLHRLWRLGASGNPPQGWESAEQHAREFSEIMQEVSLQISPEEIFLHIVWCSDESARAMLEALSSMEKKWNRCSSLLYENHAQDSRVTGPLDVSPTVSQKWGTGGGNTPIICAGGVHSNAAVDVDLCPTLTTSDGSLPYIVAGFCHKAAAAAGSIGYQEEVSPTLKAGQTHAVFACRTDQTGSNGLGISEDVGYTLDGSNGQAVVSLDCRNLAGNEELSGTLQAKSGGGYSLNYINPVLQNQIIRRLTPTECERLQGFPDGWTSHGHNGKSISDAARYRAIGNSVALPCVDYVLGGIAEVLGMTDRTFPSPACETCRFSDCWMYSPVYGIVLEPCARCGERSLNGTR